MGLPPMWGIWHQVVPNPHYPLMHPGKGVVGPHTDRYISDNHWLKSFNNFGSEIYQASHAFVDRQLFFCLLR